VNLEFKGQFRYEAEELSNKISRLSKQQYEALQRESYLRMSRHEADEYDKRRPRIREICELLAKLRANGHNGPVDIGVRSSPLDSRLAGDGQHVMFELPIERAKRQC
jgi:hypothetical protein